jgi:hypothetical protein
VKGAAFMLTPITQATAADGSAAEQTAILSRHAPIAKGYVIQASVMDLCFDERREQIDNLLKVRTAENNESVAEELHTIISTVHVPKPVVDALKEAFESIRKPVLMRLSPIGKVANPLEPAMILALDDMKSVLDAVRLLYAEMYSADNLATEDDNRSTALIMQEMPDFEYTFRVIKHNEHMIVEGEHGYGAFVAYGEPERFLFTNGNPAGSEPGSGQGIFFEKGSFREAARKPLTVAQAQAALDYAQQLFTQVHTPLLIGVSDRGVYSPLGCISHI